MTNLNSAFNNKDYKDYDGCVCKHSDKAKQPIALCNLDCVFSVCIDLMVFLR